MSLHPRVPQGGTAAPSARRRGGGAQANTVQLLQAAAGNRATAQLMRQAVKGGTAAPVSPWVEPKTKEVVWDRNRPNVIIVRRDDGSEYQVTRVPKAKVHKPEDFKYGVDRDKDNVWAYLSYCRKSKGSVVVGADVPASARAYADGITTAIKQGGNPSDVVKAIETPPKLKTFAELEFGQSGRWKFTGDASLLVTADGIKEVQGALVLDFGEWEGKVDYKSGQVNFNLKYTPGRKAPEHECQRELIKILWGYECRMLKPPADKPAGAGGNGKPGPETYSVYFDYNSAEVKASLVNEMQLSRIVRAVGKGYTVADVVGYASPEGTEAGKASVKWEGNRMLSGRRAANVLAWVEGKCPGRSCTAGVQPRVGSELHGSAGGRELFGRQLEQHVENVTGIKPHRQAYKGLRRVDITLAPPPPNLHQAGEDAARKLECPPFVILDAVDKWKQLDPQGLWGTGIPDPHAKKR